MVTQSQIELCSWTSIMIFLIVYTIFLIVYTIHHMYISHFLVVIGISKFPHASYHYAKIADTYAHPDTRFLALLCASAQQRYCHGESVRRTSVRLSSVICPQSPFSKKP